MKIKVFEDTENHGKSIIRNLQIRIGNLALNDISIIDSPILDNWDDYLEKNKNEDEYWLIDIKYQMDVSQKMNDKLDNLWQQYSDILSNSIKPNTEDYGLIVGLFAHFNDIKYSFLSQNMSGYELRYRELLNLFRSQNPHYEFKKADFVSDDTGAINAQTDFLIYLNSICDKNNILDFSAKEWVTLRGSGKYKEGIINPHHYLGAFDSLTEHTVHEKIENFKKIPSSEFVAQLEQRFYFNQNDLEGKVTNWKRPPLRTLFQDDCSSCDFERIISLSIRKSSSKLKIKYLSGEIFEKNHFLEKEKINELRESGKHPFLLYYTLNGEHINTKPMLHLWFNLSGIMNIIVDDFGFSEEPGWIKIDEIKNAYIVFLLVGGIEGENFVPFKEGLLRTGFTVMLFVENIFPRYYRDRFGKSEANSKNFCEKLIRYGAEWILYTNSDEENNYHSTCTFPNSMGVGRKSKQIDWQIRDFTPPLLAFNIKAGCVASVYQEKRKVPLVSLSEYTEPDAVLNMAVDQIYSLLSGNY